MQPIIATEQIYYALLFTVRKVAIVCL